MNTQNESTQNQDDDALRWQLQALRRDIEPQGDLWPGIAARISAAPQQQAHVERKTRVRRFAPWAMAASVLLAVGVAWQSNPASPASSQGNPLIRQQAVSMTLDYENALARLQLAGTHPEMAPVFGDLDRSAAQILGAIDRDPDARFLLDQLRRTYARRLELTQRAVLT
ncbi:MAG: hypothetical protein ACREO7_03680 [Pseudoxanthomonas sp.]